MKSKLIPFAVAAALMLNACGGKTETSVPQNTQPAASASAPAPASAPTDAAGFKPSPVDAQTEAKVREAFAEQNRKSGLEIRAVNTTQIPNLYEVVVNGNNVIYTTADFKYVITGLLLDIKSEENLTAARMAELSRVDFDKLPFDQAFKRVYGKGTHKIAVFSDPDCPHCKELEKTLDKADDLTVYIFPFPVIDPQADKARRLLCEREPEKAWHEWMVNGKAPAALPDCPAAGKIATLQKLGVSLGIQGTPTIVYANGLTDGGNIPLNLLMARASGKEIQDGVPTASEVESAVDTAAASATRPNGVPPELTVPQQPAEPK